MCYSNFKNVDRGKKSSEEKPSQSFPLVNEQYVNEDT